MKKDVFANFNIKTFQQSSCEVNFKTFSTQILGAK